MPRGGAREGAGRPKGLATKVVSRLELAKWCRASGATGELAQLTAVADGAAPLEVKLEALRHLFALFASRTYTKWLSDQAAKNILDGI